jgi:transcription-repair coupling factor (superfamily II helicase)
MKPLRNSRKTSSKSFISDESIEDKTFVKDTQIDTDFELLFPDDYINNISERLNLYTELNSIKPKKNFKNLNPGLLIGSVSYPPRQ